MVGRSIFRMRQSASIDDVESEISLLRQSNVNVRGRTIVQVYYNR